MGDSSSRGVRPLSQNVVTLIRGIAKARERRPLKREASEKGDPRAERTGPKSRNRKVPSLGRRRDSREGFRVPGWSRKCARSVGTLGSAGEGRNPATH